MMKYNNIKTQKTKLEEKYDQMYLAFEVCFFMFMFFYFFWFGFVQNNFPKINSTEDRKSINFNNNYSNKKQIEEYIFAINVAYQFNLIIIN